MSLCDNNYRIVPKIKHSADLWFVLRGPKIIAYLPLTRNIHIYRGLLSRFLSILFQCAARKTLVFERHLIILVNKVLCKLIFYMDIKLTTLVLVMEDQAHHIHCPTINHRISYFFTSKTYEKSFFSKISPAHVYYVNDNSFCMVLKLINCAFWKNQQ